MHGEHPVGFWWCSSAQTKTNRKFAGRMRSPQGLCENLVNALELLASQQRDGGTYYELLQMCSGPSGSGDRK